MKNKNFHAFFSNRLETLADLLHDEVFKPSKRMKTNVIVVPDPAMKSFLYQYFSMHSNSKIAFGIEVVTLSEALYEITRHHKKENPFYLPSLLDISVLVERKLIELYLSQDKSQVFRDLLAYLGEPKESVETFLRKKIISLAEQIARFFNLLELQPQQVIQDWLKEDGWHQRLWKDIFSLETGWSFPEEVLNKISPTLSELYLFGFSFIPKLYLDFFQKIDIVSFIVSPSECFWEDLYSNKERVFLQKVLEGKKVRLKVRQQLDMYLRETNPLLGNWGKQGREFLKNLGPIEPYIEEYYVDSPQNTLLAKIQNDFLSLAQEEYSPDQVQGDCSFQVHSCTSKIREVEVLLEALQQRMMNSDNLQPCDISVLSPNIEEYIPYIHQVFSESALCYRIIDVKQTSKEDILQALECLFSLARNRFDKSSILELFSYYPFQEKQGWKTDEIRSLTKCIERIGINWGMNLSHREEVLKNSIGVLETVSVHGTWEHGIERAISGLIFAPFDDLFEETTLFPWPEYCVDWTESEFFGRVVLLINQLYRDIKKLEGLQTSLDEWSKEIHALSNRYFVLTEDNPLLRELYRMIRVMPSGEAQIYSLDSIQRILQSISRKKRTSYQSSSLQSITFSSMKSGGVIPHKSIYLLGMNEDSFPRKDLQLSICDLSKLRSKSYLPKKEDEERYLFLEVLMSARESLDISFCRISSEDHKIQTCSVIVEELLSFIEQRFSTHVKDASILTHPALSFHEEYFSNASVFTPLSSYIQRAAKSFYVHEKKNIEPFFKEIYQEVASPASSKSIEKVSMQELANFAKHPIKYYMHNSLGIYIPSLFQQEATEFILPAYEKAKMKKNVFSKGFQNTVSMGKVQGKLPGGLFEKIAIKKFKEETDVIFDLLSSFSIYPQDIVSFHLRDACMSPQQLREICSLPPLRIKSPKGTEFVIEGIIPDISPRGMLVPGENKVKDIIAIWPLFLAYLCSKDKTEYKGELMFLLKKGEAISFDIPSPEETLGAYLDYYLEAKNVLSFLIPAWSEYILEDKKEEFAKKMKSQEFLDVSPFPDDVMRWIFLKDQPPSLEGMEGLRSRIHSKIFNPIFNRRKMS